MKTQTLTYSKVYLFLYVILALATIIGLSLYFTFLSKGITLAMERQNMEAEMMTLKTEVAVLQKDVINAQTVAPTTVISRYGLESADTITYVSRDASQFSLVQ